MLHTRKRGILFGIVLIISLVGIGFGSLMVWNSFTEFDRTILSEKDRQFNSLIQSADVTLSTSISGFEREAESFFSRRNFGMTNAIWNETGNTDAIADDLAHSSINDNSLYAGMVVYRNNKVVRSLSTEDDIEIISRIKSRNLTICRNNHDVFFLAYEHKMGDGVAYYALLDLKNLMNEIATDEQSSEDMTFMVDEDCSILVYKQGDLIETLLPDDSIDENLVQCMKFIQECQSSGTSKAQSIDMIDEEADPYTARMMVMCSADTANELFTIGKTSNYDKTLKPSRTAAKKILMYGLMIIIGTILILVLLISLRVISSNELEILRKRNDTMKEINREMQAMSHHQRLETIGTMTAGIAHEFNNLLTPIMGYSMMTMEMLPEDAADLQDNLMEVYNSSMKAKEIVSGLADLSRKSDGTAFCAVDPDELIDKAIKVSQPVKPENVDVKTSLICNNHSIYGDRTQLSQLAVNLLLNAYDAMREKGGTLHVSSTYENGNVVLKFRDNGSGMDAETVAKIFDPFFTTKESGKGTGLGLAIVANIAEAHNARIYVDSEPGIGTEFTVIFSEITED